MEDPFSHLYLRLPRTLSPKSKKACLKSSFIADGQPLCVERVQRLGYPDTRATEVSKSSRVGSSASRLSALVSSEVTLLTSLGPNRVACNSWGS